MVLQSTPRGRNCFQQTTQSKLFFREETHNRALLLCRFLCRRRRALYRLWLYYGRCCRLGPFLLRNILLLVVFLKIYPLPPAQQLHENPSLPIFSRVLFTSRFPGVGSFAASFSPCCTLFVKESLHFMHNESKSHGSRCDLLRPFCRFLFLFLFLFFDVLLLNSRRCFILVRICISSELANAISFLFLIHHQKGYSNHIFFFLLIEQIRIILHFRNNCFGNGLLFHFRFLWGCLGEESLQRALRRCSFDGILLG